MRIARMTRLVIGQRLLICSVAFLTVFACGNAAWAATYEVGPSQAYTSIGAVPWESLQPGDVVLIHWREQPYREKWLVGRRGTAAAPIVIRGVAGPAGQRPVIDGNGATTRLQLETWTDARGVIVIGGSSIPADTTPAWIVVEDLEITGAHVNNQFTDDSGGTQSYSSSAGSIYIEKGENIVIRNNVLRGSSNGFFVASSDTVVSTGILFENNYVYGNGVVGSVFQHNSYTAAKGIVFQGNRYGPLMSGASGNNLKDRSSGCVIRYNWIEGGNRQLDLVHAEDSIQIRNDPAYRQTYVYGNILIEPDAAGNRQVVHYGGDVAGVENMYRKGTLYFYNNTVITHRSDRTTLFRLSTNDESADMRNNIVYVSVPGSVVALLDADGALTMRRNYMPPGYLSIGNINHDGSNLTGTSPGFTDASAQDYSLVATAAVRNIGVALNSAVLPTHDVVSQYQRHQRTVARPRDATIDLGAFEVGGAIPSPPTNLRIIK